MNMEERIARINALYHKSKTEGLTEEEILNYFQAAHLLHGDDVIFKIKK